MLPKQAPWREKRSSAHFSPGHQFFKFIHTGVKRVLLAGEWHRREIIPSPRRDVPHSRHLAIWTEGAKEVENAQSGAQSDTSLVRNAPNELGSLGPVAAIPFSAIKGCLTDYQIKACMQ